MLPVPHDPRRLEEICRRYHVVRLAFFGSALRPGYPPDSDLDVLVEFQPGKTPGLRFFDLQEELAELFGRRVDLNTSGFLSRYFRDQVLAEARELFVA